MYILIALSLILAVHCVIFFVSRERCPLCEFYARFSFRKAGEEPREELRNCIVSVDEIQKQQGHTFCEGCALDLIEFNNYKLNQNLRLLDIISQYQSYLENNPMAAHKIFVGEDINELKLSVGKRVLSLSKEINNSRLAS